MKEKRRKNKEQEFFTTNHTNYLKTMLCVICYICLLLSSCDDNIFTLPEIFTPVDVSVEGVEAGVDVAVGYGKVKINFTHARTLFPTLKFDSYKYYFTPVVDGEEITEETIELLPEEGNVFSLQLGTWKITVVAYVNDSDNTPLFAASGSAVFTVSGEAMMQLSIPLAQTEAAGYGNFSVNISFPEEATLELYMENLLDGDVAIDESFADGTAIQTFEDIPAGMYMLSVRIRKGGAYTGIGKAVHIYPFLTTEYGTVTAPTQFSEQVFINSIPKLSDYIITDQEKTYDGSSHTVTITPIGSAPLPSEVYYTNAGYTGSNPVNAGEYTVTFNTEEGNGWNAAVLTATLTIVPVAASADDFDVSPYLVYLYDGTQKEATVTPKAEIIGADVTIWYENSDDKTDTPPSDTDNYAVTFDVSGNYTATGLSAGTLVIAEVFTSVELASAYLANPNVIGTLAEPAPLPVAFDLDESYIYNLFGFINNIGKYIALDLSICTMAEGAFDLSSIGTMGKDRIVSLILPDTAERISTQFNFFNNLKEVEGKNINSLCEMAFGYCTSLESVSLPLATGISNGAFINCTNLTNVNLPLLESIGQLAFAFCTSLENVSFLLAESIGEYAFASCSNITSVNIPLAESIGQYAFAGCSNITSVNIPLAESIGQFAFQNCTSLTNVNFPLVESIGDNAFGSSINLENVNFPIAISIGDTAFSGCTGLSSINIPLVEYIGNGAFFNCTNLENISSPLVEIIDVGAFTNCSSLEKVYFPLVKKIEYGTFQGCTSLESVFFPLVESIENHAFTDCDSLTDITIAQDCVFVTHVQSERFLRFITVYETEGKAGGTYLWNGEIWEYAGLTTIEQVIAYLAAASGGDSVDNPVPLRVALDLGTMTNVDSNWLLLLGAIEGADKYVDLDLANCWMNGTEFNPGSTVVIGKSKIIHIKLPDTATSIPNGGSSTSAFSHFDNILSFTGTMLTSIGDYAFYNCTSLALTELPAGVTSIGQSAFSNCTSLALISLPAGITKIEYGVFQYCRSLALTELPTGITSIGMNAFSGCSSLSLNSLPEGITEIGRSAFSGCENLALTSLPEGITSINERAFAECNNLALTELPAGITTIGLQAFSFCTSLELSSLPVKLISIGEGAFRSCTSLALTELPVGITEIGGSAFWNCTSLALTSLPEGITSISSSAFQSCTNLTYISLPQGITSIGGSAFYNCTMLEFIEIPAGVTNIGNSAFGGCTNLALIVCHAETPPQMGISVFANIPYSLEIQVPAESVDAYKEADGWRDYADRIGAID